MVDKGRGREIRRQGTDRGKDVWNEKQREGWKEEWRGRRERWKEEGVEDGREEWRGR